MIRKKLVQWYASDAAVDLDIAERDVVLTYVLRFLFEEGFLDQLAFKGGTAIRKLHLGKTGRFSLDLDFSAISNAKPENLVLELAALLDRQTFYGIAFRVQDTGYWATEESCGADVTYAHEWMAEGHFRVEISCRAPPLIPPTPTKMQAERYFQWMEIQPPQVVALDLREVIGEKIRAAVQRARVRDVYDLYQFASKPYDRALVRLIAVVKCWESRCSFDPRAFLVGLGDRRYDWGDLARLVRRDQLSRAEQMVHTVRDAYSFLENLTAEEARLGADPYGREVQLYTDLVKELRSKAR